MLRTLGSAERHQSKGAPLPMWGAPLGHDLPFNQPLFRIERERPPYMLGQCGLR